MCKSKMSEPCKPCKPPFLVITRRAPTGKDMNAYYVYMKEHPNPEKNGVYVVDIDHPLNVGVFRDFPSLKTDGKEYGLQPNNDYVSINGGRRISKKRPTARRRRSSKARKARATRRR
jgi:hypothetical protein